MKFIHTADWHLGKLIQGVYMTEDQRYVLQQLIEVVKEERPDAVVIAGDLYDRAIPPTEAVELLDDILEQIVIDLATPVIAIAGNHDSPDRINFASKILAGHGLHLVGQLHSELKPVVLHDEFGEVHFHLVPYADPAYIRHQLKDDTIHSHDDAMRAIVSRLETFLAPTARHVFVGHAFVTPGGEPKLNTSTSERPLAIGGAEHVRADYYQAFHYTALGHLHQAHYVQMEKIRYAGSPLKYSISEEHHHKGFLMVELDGSGAVVVEKRPLTPIRDMRRVTGTMEEIERHPICDDYVFVRLLDENPLFFPMEKVRAVYPNALHVERKVRQPIDGLPTNGDGAQIGRLSADPVSLFASFYQEVNGIELSKEKRKRFAEVYLEVVQEDGGAV